MVHLFTLANVLVRMRYKNKRIFLSFCVFTTRNHVPTSMYKLLNNLAKRFDDTNFTCARCGVRYATDCSLARASDTKRLIQNRKTKNKDTPTRVISGGRICHLSAIRYGSVPSQETTAQQASIHFGYPKRSTHVSQTQSVRHMCHKHKVFRSM